jgi:hypothetical protein
MSMENYGEIISTGKLLIRLWKSYQQSHLVAKQENLEKEMMNLAFKVSLFILRSEFLHSVKSYDMGPTALLPVGGKVCC